MSYRYYAKFYRYGVATISRLLKMIGLFCKRALHRRLYSAKETHDFKEPGNRSHPKVSLPSKFHMCDYANSTRVLSWKFCMSKVVSLQCQF